MRIGRRIVELRSSQGLTQQEFASRIGTSVQWLSRVELGQENLTLQTLVKLAANLGVEVTSLFEQPTGEGGVRRGRPSKTRA